METTPQVIDKEKPVFTCEKCGGIISKKELDFTSF
jgi:hypothetical protein